MLLTSGNFPEQRLKNHVKKRIPYCTEIVGQDDEMLVDENQGTHGFLAANQ